MSWSSSVHVDIPFDTKAPRTASASLEAIAPEIGPELTDTARLLVNELFTSTLLCASRVEDLSLQVELTPAFLRVVLGDLCHAPGGGLGWISARGFPLVDVMADRWGVSMNGTTEIWFEIDR